MSHVYRSAVKVSWLLIPPVLPAWYTWILLDNL